MFLFSVSVDLQGQCAGCKPSVYTTQERRLFSWDWSSRWLSLHVEQPRSPAGPASLHWESTQAQSYIILKTKQKNGFMSITKLSGHLLAVS